MHAEIIAIGDEITSGQLLDTNTHWLSGRLGELGLPVLYHTTVGDSLSACSDVFRTALDRSDVVISTGGLGPTDDDLTRAAIAGATDRELTPNAAALEHVRAMFARRRRQMPERNERQALFPTGAEVIHNPNGTAPGIDLTVPREGRGPARLFALPGVPAEMKEMWRESVADAVARFAGTGHVIRHRAIKCFGAGESQIEAMLPDLIRRGRRPRVGINASRATIILRITAEGDTEQEALAAMEPTVRLIHEKLGSLVFGEGDDELQDAVARLLARHGKTLATAEWGTTGLVADWMGDIEPEHQGVYLGGVIAQSDAALREVLGIAPGVLARHPAESAEIAGVMASSCRQRFGADYGLAVARFPQPGDGSTAHFAVASPDGVTVRGYPYASHPALLRILCAKIALNLVRLELLAR